MSNVIKHRGYNIRIEQDQDPGSPREWDNLGVMTCDHRRYNLGDEEEQQYLKQCSFDSWGDVRKYLEKERGAVVILPMFMMDHSGLSISCSSDMFRAVDSAGWDWGQIGFIWVTREKLLSEYGGKRLTKKIREQAIKVLAQEVETYHQYMSGDVYGYIIEDEDGEHMDSCCGCFGYEYTVEEAKGAAENLPELCPAEEE